MPGGRRYLEVVSYSVYVIAPKYFRIETRRYVNLGKRIHTQTYVCMIYVY